MDLSTSPRRETHWSWLGQVPYEEALRLQLVARDALVRGEGPEQLLLLEHPHVYTLGRNASEDDLLLDAGERAERGIEVAVTDRGGQVTYHGPGQLVGYPILDLNPDRRDLRRYVRDLQEVLVRTLAELGIASAGGEGERIGVWVNDGRSERKIASIGIHLSRWRTTHGFALNVATDLGLFRGIVACGLPEVDMTSIARERGLEVKSAPPLEEVAARLRPHFAAVFGRRLVAATPSVLASAAAGRS
jgi:lipoyl(octanoyl) transferase